MNRTSQRTARFAVVAALIAGSSNGLLGQAATSNEPVRRTTVFRGAQREYFVALPPTFDRSKSYWPLVVVHGGGGNGRTFFLATGISGVVAEVGFDAIVISPSFPNDDDNASRFPALREGDFLQAVMKEMRGEYPLKPRMLLTGYSRGGQFAHRFALAHPEQVAAVAPFASGTWTTPDGRLLVEELGEVREASVFLSNSGNATRVPERLRDLFEPRVAAVADAKAVGGAREIPFLVMCGTFDSRLPIAQEFVRSPEALQYDVKAEWPRTPHTCGGDATCRAEFDGEFQKYSRRAVAFFQRIGGQ